MRIAVVHSFYSSDSPSGENSVVSSQIDALRRAGHDVELFSKHTDVEKDISLYKVRSALRAANISGPGPGDELVRFNPDIVHVHNLFPNWSTRWTAAWKSRLVATLHNYRTICASGIMWRDGHDCQDCLRDGSFSAVRHKCYRGSTVATIPLAYASRSFGAHSPLLSNAQTLIVLNARAKEIFDTTASRARVELVPNFAAATKGSSGAPTDGWVFVGRLTEEKGVAWLLKHWPRTRKLTLVGAGPLAQEIEQAVAAEPDRFAFRGQVAPDHAAKLIQSSMGLIMPSLWSEGIPTVALEALQAGTPVVVSDSCSSAGELTRGVAGRIFTTEDGGASLEAALHDVETTGSRMRCAAKDVYSRHFSEDAWLARVQSIYDRTVSSGHR